MRAGEKPRHEEWDPDQDVASDGGVVFTPGLMLYIAGRNKIGFNVDV